jgi:hypothetical protein
LKEDETEKTLTMVAEKYATDAYIELLSHLDDTIFCEEWAACAAERRVSGDMYALFVTEVFDLLLWQ